ncbi:hypothetical protein PMIN03_001918 [Paraphaeosphaeria minitans]
MPFFQITCSFVRSIVQCHHLHMPPAHASTCTRHHLHMPIPPALALASGIKSNTSQDGSWHRKKENLNLPTSDTHRYWVQSILNQYYMPISMDIPWWRPVCKIQGLQLSRVR